MPAPSAPSPLIWILLGHRTGDNAQLRALAAALSDRVEEKHLAWRRPKPIWTPLYGRRETLAPLANSARATLAAPWPDLVLSIGWRSVPIANWVASQSGAAKVHLGRPRAPFELFDLILTTPQYRLPDAPNLRRLAGPVTGPSEADLAEAAATWAPRLDHLPRPWIAILVGGSAPPLLLAPADGARLGEAANAVAEARGGSLLVATSPRTSAASALKIRSEITVPSHVFSWGSGDENPYLGYLALADEVIVTADSVSMLWEASRQGRPLHIFPLRRRVPSLLPPLDGLPGIAALRRQGLTRAPRRAEAFCDALISTGQAVWIGAPWGDGAIRPSPDPLQQAVQAIHEMMQQRN